MKPELERILSGQGSEEERLAAAVAHLTSTPEKVKEPTAVNITEHLSLKARKQLGQLDQ